MTGSGSVIVGYFSSKKDCELAKLYMKKNSEIIGVLLQKLYEFYFFVLYENDIGA